MREQIKIKLYDELCEPKCCLNMRILTCPGATGRVRAASEGRADCRQNLFNNDLEEIQQGLALILIYPNTSCTLKGAACPEWAVFSFSPHSFFKYWNNQSTLKLYCKLI